MPDPAPLPAPVRPIGAWLVGLFLLFASLAMWSLAAAIFQARS